MMLLAFCGLATASFAQQAEESYPTLKRSVITNRFWDNWFISAGVDHLAFYNSAEHGKDLNKNPFWTGRRSWNFDLSVGKWCCPNVGFRVKGMGAWGTLVLSPEGGLNPTYSQWSVSVQPMVNLTNLIGGYKPRWWEISLYAGAGVQRNCSSSNYSVLADFGVLNTWNVTKRFHINLDVFGRMLECSSDFVKGYSYNDWEGTSHNYFQSRDWIVGFSAGVGVNLGKVGWDAAPDMDAVLANHKSQIDALNAAIAGLEGENADLKNKLKNQPTREVVKTVTEFYTTKASVFFNLNSSKIASRKDLVNVQEVAELAKAHNKRILVVGSADSKTGNAKINDPLSERRAKAVVEELVKMGVSRDMIDWEARGGIDDIAPYTYNRRAVVSLK